MYVNLGNWWVFVAKPESNNEKQTVHEQERGSEQWPATTDQMYSVYTQPEKVKS
jgi:hypothetical protein